MPLTPSPPAPSTRQPSLPHSSQAARWLSGTWKYSTIPGGLHPHLHLPTLGDGSTPSVLRTPPAGPHPWALALPVQQNPFGRYFENHIVTWPLDGELSACLASRI